MLLEEVALARTTERLAHRTGALEVFGREGSRDSVEFEDR